MATDCPLDFSYYELVDPADIEGEEPRAQLKKKFIKEKVIEENEDGEQVEVEKYRTSILKLCNNNIHDYGSLMKVTMKVVVEPQNIFWIDMSFNVIEKIDPVLCEFEKLGILYLHGNKITDQAEVNKLSQLIHLKKLSLHGNPLENVKDYRSMVLATLPKLTTFDMSGVTKSDRATAANFKPCNRNTKKKSSKQQD